MDFGIRSICAQFALDHLRGVLAARIAVTQVKDEARLAGTSESGRVLVKESDAGIAASRVQRHVVLAGDWIYHAGERILLQPDLDPCVDVGPTDFCDSSQLHLQELQRGFRMSPAESDSGCYRRCCRSRSRRNDEA